MCLEPSIGCIDATFQGFWGGSRVRGGFIGGGDSWGDKYLVKMEWKTLTYDNLVFEKPFTMKWRAEHPTDWVVDRPFKTIEEPHPKWQFGTLKLRSSPIVEVPTTTLTEVDLIHLQMRLPCLTTL